MSLSRLKGWPTHSPVNASPTPSRAPTHDSAPMRLATPSSQWTLTTYSLPVSRRTPNPPLSGDRRVFANFWQALACSADLSPALAKQLLDSTAAGSRYGRGPTGPTSRSAPGAASGTRLSPQESRDFSSPPTTTRAFYLRAPKWASPHANSWSH